MAEPNQPLGVIPARAVRRETQPAIVDAGPMPGSTMTVVPHVDGDRIAALEVRCSCGSSVIVECGYGEEQA